MANLYDYLKWRGDLSFRADAFNEVDNLILSELVYTDFGGIVPSGGPQEGISLQEANDLFFEQNDVDEIMAKVTSTKVAPFLMEEMLKTKRFKDIILFGYYNEIDPDSQSQFCAMSYKLPDGRIFVCYRGTDDTMIGWKEDFNMLFMYATKGQLMAVKYLNDYYKDGDNKLIIGGHSKGGNFAMYAAMNCEESVKDRIQKIYSNDGPGFNKDIIAKPEYKQMARKLHSMLPDESFFGLLLEHKVKHVVIKSDATGRAQHNMLTWQILGDKCIRADSLKSTSLLIDKGMKEWIYSFEPEERKDFVNILFDFLNDNDVKVLDDFSDAKKMRRAKITKYLSSLPKDKQYLFWEVIGRFAKAGVENLVGGIQEKFSAMQIGGKQV